MTERECAELHEQRQSSLDRATLAACVAFT